MNSIPPEYAAGRIHYFKPSAESGRSAFQWSETTLFIVVERRRPDLTYVKHISYYCSQSGTWHPPWNFGSEVPLLFTLK